MFLRLSITTVGVLATFALSATIAVAQTKSQKQLPALSHSLVANNQPSQNPQSFQDSHGRYTLSVPSGWETSMSGDDPTFHNGASWVQVRIIKADSPSAAVDQAATAFRPQFTVFSTINRGNTTIAGRPSHGLNVDATTPAGQRVSVLLTAQPEGKKQYFVLVSATPVAQAPQLNTSVMALANSVRFNAE